MRRLLSIQEEMRVGSQIDESGVLREVIAGSIDLGVIGIRWMRITLRGKRGEEDKETSERQP